MHVARVVRACGAGGVVRDAGRDGGAPGGLASAWALLKVGAMSEVDEDPSIAAGGIVNMYPI